MRQCESQSKYYLGTLLLRLREFQSENERYHGTAQFSSHLGRINQMRVEHRQ
jgi:hypothetical protein